MLTQIGVDVNIIIAKTKSTPIEDSCYESLEADYVERSISKIDHFKFNRLVVPTQKKSSKKRKLSRFASKRKSANNVHKRKRMSCNKKLKKSSNKLRRKAKTRKEVEDL